MMKNQFKFILSIFFIVILLSDCSHHENEKHTSSGMKYIVYKENPGPKAKVGDFVTINMVYKTENDSVLFNSMQNKLPMRFQLSAPKFMGSMEDGLTYMAAGDSATFFVSADSMVQKVFSKMGGADYVRPAFLKSGSFVKFDLKLLRIQNALDAAQEMYQGLDSLAAKGRRDIEKYVKDHNISQKPDSAGIYLVKNTEGKGTAIGNGKSVSVIFTGKFLNDVVFDSNAKDIKPYTFTVGKAEVIKGWDIEFAKLKQGDKVTMIVPSDLAYGEEGLRNKKNGMYVIQPNTPLLFDVEIVSVK